MESHILLWSWFAVFKGLLLSKELLFISHHKRNRADQDGHTYGSYGYKCAARCIPGAVLHVQYLEPPNAELGKGTG